jgi:hypothetical protein
MSLSKIRSSHRLPASTLLPEPLSALNRLPPLPPLLVSEELPRKCSNADCDWQGRCDAHTSHAKVRRMYSYIYSFRMATSILPTVPSIGHFIPLTPLHSIPLLLTILRIITIFSRVPSALKNSYCRRWKR